MDNIPKGFNPVDASQPFGALIGPIYYWFNDEDLESDEWLLGFRVEKRHCNRIGGCHGAMTFSFIDMVSGQIAAEKQLGPVITVSLQADFIRPIKFDDWVTGKSKLLWQRDDNLYIETEIYVKNRIVATSSSHWKQIRKRPSFFK